MARSGDNAFNQGLEYPVLILSSEAGFGNRSVGDALKDVLDQEKGVYHVHVESLLPVDIVSKDFERYRLICEKAPWILYFMYGMPIAYWLKYRIEDLIGKDSLTALSDFIKERGIKTIFATNHRALFWSGFVRRRNNLDCEIRGLLTDYCVNPGWRYLPWNEVSVFYGPIEKDLIYPELRDKYVVSDIPIEHGFNTLSGVGDVNNVLVTGGGWGLGDIEDIVSDLLEVRPTPKIHVVCGANDRLFQRLLSRRGENLMVYGTVDSLLPLMGVCASIITKPGGVTLTEAFHSKRQIFLIPGLPVCEKKNEYYAINNFGAKNYSTKSFRKWYSENISV
ncbi:MAG: hypothetical protein ABIH11_02180 [Candidatus Altiarchaeota archaeon]